VAVIENGKALMPHIPIQSARFNHMWLAEDRNKAPPDKSNAQFQAVAPTGLPRNADAIAREAKPINQ
jgi:hypothetical protein